MEQREQSHACMSFAESRQRWAIAKDGTVATKEDGSVMTKQEAIATNILNQAMNRRSSESRAKRLAA